MTGGGGGRDPFEVARRSIREIPPGPGTFDTVLRRAAERRRRRMIAISAAALVVLAGGIGGLVGALSGGGKGGDTPPATISGQPLPPGRTATPSPSTAQSPTGAGRAATAPTPTATGGGPVPAGFTPRSISFVAGGRGWLLGDAPTCASRPCTSLLRTSDGGATWRGGPAPVAPLATPGGPDSPGTIRDVRFADATNGYAFGGALYATADGGDTWRRVSISGNHVADLAAWGGVTYLVTETCSGTDCRGGRLYQLGPGDSAPTPVAGWPALGPDARIALQDGVIAVAARNTADGVDFQLDVAAPGQAPADRGDVCGRDLGGLAAAAGGVLWAGCNGGAGGADVRAQVSTDDGRTWRTTAAAPPVGKGEAASAAALSASTAVLTGQDDITATSDGGRTWRRVILPPPVSPSLRLVFVGFTDAADGYVIAGGGGPAQLWRTSNGGAGWSATTFR